MTALRVPFVDLKAQYREFKGEIDRSVLEVCENGGFVLGEPVARFESCFARYLGCRHAVGVSSGLDALRLALVALDIGPGDEVILPANTFIATAFAVSAVGARPVLVDMDPRSFNMDPDLTQKAITKATRAIMPVHLYGQPADMEAITDIARRHELFVIEDACQAHGSRYKGRRTGTWGDIGCFSFYPTKNLGAYGDGGALVTNDAKVAERAACLRNYGQQARYHHVEKGWTARLDTLQAAVLTVKMQHLDEWNRRRSAHAMFYDERLSTIGDLRLPEVLPERDHVFHVYVVRTQRRDQLQAFLRSREIETLIHYPVPIHLQEAYSDAGYTAGDFPNTEHAATEILSLPMYAEMQRSQQEYVVETIGEFFSN